MTLYTFTGSQETVFPTLADAAGHVLVCRPGDTVDLADDPGHPLLKAKVPAAPAAPPQAAPATPDTAPAPAAAAR